VALGQRDASVLRRFEEFCALEGLRVDRALEGSDVIEAFLTIGCSTLRAHSRGTYRSTLRRLGGAPPTTRGFPASLAPAPYGEADLAALWSRANHQTSRTRIANATVALAGQRDYLFRPNASVRDTKNLVGEIAASLGGDADDVTLSSGRCRSTFLCRHLAADTPLHELCALAGLIGVESLLRYARHVASAPQTKAALRARAARH